MKCDCEVHCGIESTNRKRTSESKLLRLLPLGIRAQTPVCVCPCAKFTEMAAHSPSSIRVRLHFDYPPPAVVDCRMCWLLVDLNTCRVVADLEGTIREKFEFSRRSILKLFIDDCYLPHTEGIDVVRDNDNVRCAFFQRSPRPLLIVGVNVCLWCNGSLSANMTEEKTYYYLSSSFWTDRTRHIDQSILPLWSFKRL